MITVTKRLEFDYGHRVLGHEGKCKNLHGHRGVAEITVGISGGLDAVGRVIDFSVIKEKVGGWINANWDHEMLLHPADPLIDWMITTGSHRPYVMQNGNPTAENMTIELFNAAQDMLQYPLQILKVRLWETPTCYAEYSE